MRAPVYAIAGFVFLILGADDFLLEGTGPALVFLPVAITFEAAAAQPATSGDANQARLGHVRLARFSSLLWSRASPRSG